MKIKNIKHENNCLKNVMKMKIKGRKELMEKEN
jgi:hypothetical protein